MTADPLTLDAYLAAWTAGDPRMIGAAEAVVAVAGACLTLSARIRRGPIGGRMGAVIGTNADGDEQKALDVWANDLLVEALRVAGVRAVASEEMDEALDLAGPAAVAVAFDPLDGSSNIDTNVSIGTIFTVLPSTGRADQDFLQPGSAQLAAGYVLYGPHTSLMLTVGDGVQCFTLDPEDNAFVLTDPDVQVAPRTNEYAINASNYRHWGAAVRAYIDACVAGRDGPRDADCNMRWIGSLVADCHRILVRGGVYLYPRDLRPGYEDGRLRLVYEGNPIAFLIEQAGGKAFDGRTRILDLVPTSLHQRTPLMFGSSEEVDRIARNVSHPDLVVARAPLFHRRGLFKR